jgi:hypothetical protein
MDHFLLSFPVYLGPVVEETKVPLAGLQKVADHGQPTVLALSFDQMQVGARQNALPVKLSGAWPLTLPGPEHNPGPGAQREVQPEEAVPDQGQSAKQQMMCWQLEADWTTQGQLAVRKADGRGGGRGGGARGGGKRDPVIGSRGGGGERNGVGGELLGRSGWLLLATQ